MLDSGPSCLGSQKDICSFIIFDGDKAEVALILPKFIVGSQKFTPMQKRRLHARINKQGDAVGHHRRQGALQLY